MQGKARGLLALAFAALLVGACSDDDDNGGGRAAGSSGSSTAAAGGQSGSGAGSAGAGTGGAGAGGTGGNAGAGGADGSAGAGGNAGAGSGSGGAGGASGAAGAGAEGGSAGQVGGGAGGGVTIVRQAATGGSHSCAVVDGGQVRCWGNNWAGQLGDGTMKSATTPTTVLQSPGGPPLVGVEAVSLGEGHSCARLENGEARCWGENRDGQLGDGTTTDRLTPVNVLQAPGGPPLVGVKALSAGKVYGCALLEGGQVQCWGANYGGQLGDGTTIDRLTAVKVLQAPGGPPLAGADALAVGATHGCARLGASGVRCWGSNAAGQLGDGTTVNRLTPVAVLAAPGGPPLAGVEALSAGEGHSCARLASGEMRCWGSNGHGQLGDGTTIDRLTPTLVLQAPGGAPLAGVQEISLGQFQSCALLDDSSVRCWGDNEHGQLGDNTNMERHNPVPLLQPASWSPMRGVRGLATSGYYHGCAWLDGADVRCWGLGGDGTDNVWYVAVPVHFDGPGGAGGGGAGGVSVIGQVETGGLHNCAIVDGGRVRCWGANLSGELGNGTTSSSAKPGQVLQWMGGPPLSGVEAISLGLQHSCALLAGGEVRCWGDNLSGQLGDDSTIRWRETPVPVRQSPGGPSLTGMRAITLGDRHTCAITNEGRVLCWGHGSKGQLGDGISHGRLTPVMVLESPGGPPLTGVKALALGDSHTCARLSDDDVRCWGGNEDGQLGDGTTIDRLTPVKVLQAPGGPPLVGVKALSAGERHSCARFASGEMRCWGRNNRGQLGDGTTTSRASPVPVLSAAGGPIAGVEAITLGLEHSCALLGGGRTFCWGRNTHGQLGNGTVSAAPNPTPAPVLRTPDGSLLTGVGVLLAGGQHGCAWFGSLDLRCWGYNGVGTLGDGTTINHYTPVSVEFLAGRPSHGRRAARSPRGRRAARSLPRALLGGASSR